MPQINLLSSNTAHKPNIGQVALGIGVKILAGLLAILLIYYAWLFVSSRQTNAKLADLQASIAQSQKDILAQKDREELIVRQGQLDALKTILQNHVYWSNLFPKLAQATLNTASYVSFSAIDDGTGVMEVSVPTYADLDKFLQVFDFPQFAQNFSDLRITSISKSQEGSTLETKAQLKFKYNSGLIKKTTTSNSSNSNSTAP